MTTRRAVIIAAATSLSGGLILALFIFFNVGGIKDTLAGNNTYYSRTDGRWDKKQTWSSIGFGGPQASTSPGSGDIVYIKGHQVELKQDESCATLYLYGGNSDTELKIKANKSLTISGNLAMDQQGSANKLELAGDPHSNLSVGGNLTVLNDGSEEVKLEAKQMDLTVNGDFNVESTGSGEAIMEMGNHTNLVVNGNLSLIQQAGTGQVKLEMDNHATADINGHIILNANDDQLVYWEMGNHTTLNLGGTITRNPAPGSYGNFTMGMHTKLVLDGTTAQVIASTNAAGSDVFEYAEVEVNNTSSIIPQFTLEDDVVISDKLTFTFGIIEATASNQVIFEENAQASPTHSSSYITGSVAKTGTSSFTFPFYNGNGNQKIGVSNISSNSTFSASYTPSAFSNTTSFGSGLVDVSNQEYFTLTREAGNGSARVALHWSDGTASGISDLTSLVVARWDEQANEWVNVGQHNRNGGTNSGSVTSHNTTEFGTFTFGTTNSNNALPVELLVYHVRPQQKDVVVEWSTGSELNNDYFTIERSQDGYSFQRVAQVKGAGTIQQETPYSWVDKSPLSGISYYRLKQTDFDGSTETFDVKSVSLEAAGAEQLIVENIGPNPFASQFGMDYNLPVASTLELRLVDVNGRVLHEETVSGHQGSNHYTYQEGSKLENGVYFLIMNANGRQLTQKVVKRG